MHRIRGVIIGDVYSGRKEVIGFTHNFVRVLYVVNSKVIYYPCNEDGIIITNLKSKTNLLVCKLDIFVERYEIYVPN